MIHESSEEKIKSVIVLSEVERFLSDLDFNGGLHC